MGRKKTYDVQELVKKMGKIFITYGYEATSLDYLERGTGLLRGSLYREFGSKRTMFELSLLKYIETEPEKSSTLDLLIIGFQELASRDQQIQQILRKWYLEKVHEGKSVAELLGNRLIECSKIGDWECEGDG